MDYKIEQKPAFRVLGRRQRFSMKDEEQLQLIPKMWDWLTKERCARMLGVAAAPDIFGVCEMVGEDELDYWIAVASKAGGLEELESLEIPAATWAVFESVGPIPSAIQELERRIYGEWFSSSGYKRAPGPDIERYPPGDKESKGYYCEVWVPIEKE